MHAICTGCPSIKCSDSSGAVKFCFCTPTEFRYCVQGTVCAPPGKTLQCMQYEVAGSHTVTLRTAMGLYRTVRGDTSSPVYLSDHYSSKNSLQSLYIDVLVETRAASTSDYSIRLVPCISSVYFFRVLWEMLRYCIASINTSPDPLHSQRWNTCCGQMVSSCCELSAVRLVYQ